MKRHFSAPTPRFGRINNRLGVGHQQRSPYYWWWQYLRRNADYIACCERGGKGRLSKLYKDFGDVREDNFHKWWTEGDRGVELFAEQPLAVSLSELHPADQKVLLFGDGFDSSPLGQQQFFGVQRVHA